jgi:hypothetical protein
MTTAVQKQVLINARALIADPAHWTRGTIARTANGRKVEWHDQSATKWCAMGAMYRAAYDLVGDQNKRFASATTWPTAYAPAVGSAEASLS